jgi:signal transduction histidine kinase
VDVAVRRSGATIRGNILKHLRHQEFTATLAIVLTPSDTSEHLPSDRPDGRSILVGPPPEPRSGTTRRTITDPWWAVAGGALSIGYLLLSIATGTGYFSGAGGPAVTSLSVWGTVAVFAVQAVPLVWRTRRPVLSFAAVYVCFLAAVGLSIDRNLSVSVTLMLSIFSLTAHTAPRAWGPSLGLAAGADLLLHLVLGATVGGGLPPVAVLVIVTRVVPTYLLPALAGLLYGAQRRRIRLEADRAEALRQAAAAQTAAAVVAERTRMARELHDVAAHHLTGILLQTRAALRVHEHDPALTAELLGSVRDEGEATLRNLREVIGLLRTEDDADDPAEVAPTLDRLPALITSVRTLDPGTALDVTGDLEDLSPATSLACFRIVQESLTNARRHAPGAAVHVDLHRTARTLVVEVRNAAPATAPPGPPRAGPGYGLVGMRERATMLGGTLETGPTPDGGWCTRAVIPLDRRAAA